MRSEMPEGAPHRDADKDSGQCQRVAPELQREQQQQGGACRRGQLDECIRVGDVRPALEGVDLRRGTLSG